MKPCDPLGAVMAAFVMQLPGDAQYAEVRLDVL